jgi:hypothetical protein
MEYISPNLISSLKEKKERKIDSDERLVHKCCNQSLAQTTDLTEPPVKSKVKVRSENK